MGEGKGKATSEKPIPKYVPFLLTRNLQRDREMHARTAPEIAAMIAAVIASVIFTIIISSYNATVAPEPDRSNRASWNKVTIILVGHRTRKYP